MSNSFAYHFTFRFYLGVAGLLLMSSVCGLTQDSDQVVRLPGSQADSAEREQNQPEQQQVPQATAVTSQPRPEPGNQAVTPPTRSTPAASTSSENLPDIQRTTGPDPVDNIPNRIRPQDRSRNEVVFENTVPQNDKSIRVGKIYQYVNQGDASVGNKALNFEAKYWNWGAITMRDRENKIGHYFVFNWKNAGTKRNLVAQFQYRQQNTADTVRTLTLRHDGSKGSEKSTFAVVGNAYETYGPINGWRFTILDESGRILNGHESFVW